MRICLHGRLKYCCPPAPLSFFAVGTYRTVFDATKVRVTRIFPSELPANANTLAMLIPTCAVRRYVSLLLKLPIRRCVLLGRSCFPSKPTITTLLFNPRWITPPLKEPETPRFTLTHTTNSRQHVSGSACEPEYANQRQDFDARSFLCREDKPALALHRSSVAPRTSDCGNGWSRYLGSYQLSIKASLRG